MKTIWRWIIGILVFLIFCGIGIWFVLSKPVKNIYVNVPTIETVTQEVPGPTQIEIMDVPGPATTLPPVTITTTRLYPYDVTTTVTTTEPRFITTTQPVYIVTTRVVATTLPPITTTQTVTTIIPITTTETLTTTITPTCTPTHTSCH